MGWRGDRTTTLQHNTQYSISMEEKLRTEQGIKSRTKKNQGVFLRIQDWIGLDWILDWVGLEWAWCGNFCAYTPTLYIELFLFFSALFLFLFLCSYRQVV